MKKPTSSSPAVLAEDAPTFIDTTIAVDKIDESPTNPRRIFNEQHLRELAENIAAIGVLQPVVVRPSKGDRFEIVFGTRRLRACVLAGIRAIPARVSDMTDAEVLMAQVVENNHRQDVHPLEEADGFRQLHEKHGRSIEELAGKIGRSKTYVQQRLKLCALKTAGRALFLAGKLTPSTALIVARIHDEKLQGKAAKEIAEGAYNGEPMSTTMAAEHVQRKYMLRLVDAPFDVKIADLVDGVPPCGACPKRTGNQPELFPDVKAADTCTDPGCFDKKASAGWKLRVREAKQDGVRVLDDKETKRVFPYPGAPSNMGGGEWIDLETKCMQDPKHRTYRQLLGRAPEGMALALDPARKVRELFPAKDVKAALKDAGHVFKAPTAPKSGGNDRPHPKASKLEIKLLELDDQANDQIHRETVAALVAELEQREPTAPQWRALLAQASDNYCDMGPAAERRGFIGGPGDKDKAPDTEVLERAEKMTAEQLRGLFFEAVVLPYEGETLTRIATVFQIDHKAIAAAVHEKTDAAKKTAIEAAKAEADEKKQADRRASRKPST